MKGTSLYTQEIQWVFKPPMKQILIKLVKEKDNILKTVWEN